ncbi:MAG: alanine--tRNA ligase [Patescibacteria group bacterium]
MKSAKEIWKNFVDFESESPRNHKRIANVSLVPNNDPSLLFVNSGMFPLVPYLAGAPHPLGKRLFNTQRSIRTMLEDMKEIGDNRHTTCFTMLGNWSLGDYFKENQLPWVAELYLEKFQLDPKRFYVSVFAGNEYAPRDEESIELWKKIFAKYGIEALVSDTPQDVQKNFDENGNLKEGPTYRIFTYDAKKNWWQRGEAVGELGGPTSEIFYDCKAEVSEKYKKDLHINDDSGRFIEIGNSVFMEFFLDENLKWKKLPQKNVDFGGGFERIVFCKQEKQDIFDTDIFLLAINKIEELSGQKYHDLTEKEKAPFRVLADHIRASVFIIGDGIIPSNKEQGYILRRFIRRAINFGNRLNLENGFTAEIADSTIDSLVQFDDYEFLDREREKIKNELLKEEARFSEVLKKGKVELEKMIFSFARHSELILESSLQNENGETLISNTNLPQQVQNNGLRNFSGKDAFYIFETFGFPLELIEDEIENRGLNIDWENFRKEFEQSEKEHQANSRAGAEQKFTGGLADKSDKVVRLHTAHHLLLASLQKVLGPHVKQRGSNITAERLRIDFSHTEKMTQEQILEVENLVNQKISENLIVERVEMKREEAEKLGAEMEFGQKYGDIVSVYFIKNSNGEIFSKEFCGGPHVSSTGELLKSGKFKILKEESSSSGVRRIKAGLV